MINTICFDLDATLVNSEQVILKTFDHVFRMFMGKECPLSEYKKYMGPPLYVTFGEFEEDKAKVDQMIDEFISYYKTIEVPLISLNPGVMEAMEYLKENGFNVALITTKFYSSSIQSITTLKIKDFFNCFMCLEKQKNHKPAPDPIYQVSEELNVPLENIMMVGDNEVDIMCGKNAHVKTALVMYNDWSKDTKEKCKPDFTLETMADLINVLKEINK